MQHNDLELILQHVCCESGDSRFCDICPANGTDKCKLQTYELDELYVSAKRISDELMSETAKRYVS